MKNQHTFFYIGLVGLVVSLVINIAMVFLQEISGLILMSIWTPIYINFLFFLFLGFYLKHKESGITARGN